VLYGQEKEEEESMEREEDVFHISSKIIWGQC
jgi:hypothetical protein